MFKTSLIFLTATAILLPAEVYAGDERKRQPRAQHKERVQKQRAPRTERRQTRTERKTSSQKPRTQENSSKPKYEAPVSREDTSVFRQHPAAQQAREQQAREWQARAERQQVVRTAPAQNAVRSNGKPRVTAPVRRGETPPQTVTRTLERSVKVTEPRKVRPPQQRERSVTRTQSTQGAQRGGYNRTVRDREVTRIRHSDQHAGERHTRRTSHADNNRRGGDRYWNQKHDRRHDTWRYRGRDRHYYGSRNYRHRHKRDIDIYFGFSPFYYGDYVFGVYSGYPYHGYSSWDYFGHWPHRYGYYRARTHWLWHHHHHHYHYGDYCPHGHTSGVSYSTNYHYGNSGSSSSVAGLLLGGIVGGIIGAEIDGGRDKTTGAVVGAVLGASIGASAANNSATYHSTSATYVPSNDVSYEAPEGVDYHTDGRHVNETTLYTPPVAGGEPAEQAGAQGQVYPVQPEQPSNESQEIRTCIKYENKNGTYSCTKWTLEYVEDGE